LSASAADLDGDGDLDVFSSCYYDRWITWYENLAVDFGDAPDTGAGTGAGDYETVAINSGPNHEIVAGLVMGASVDVDSGSLQNGLANADDTDQLPDDEDGLSDPASDLALALGTEPTVNVTVKNTTGTAGTLSGWIDYNNDGVFDNATERAQAVVPDGTTGGTVTLVFPRLLTEYTGQTYARFRLSSDPAASEPTGFAWDGDVEDYVATISGVPGIDLLGMGFDVVPDNLLDGPGTANVEFSIRNFGDTTAGAFDVQFYLSDDAIIDPATDILLSLDSSDPNYDSSEPEALHVAGLASAGRHEGVVALSVPQPDPFGTDNEYFLGMFVDANGDIAESDEGQ
jgi:GEVED domain-containing protein